MARHITAKKQLTRERALALIDQHIRMHEALRDEDGSNDISRRYHRISIEELGRLRDDFEFACSTGVFPPSK